MTIRQPPRVSFPDGHFHSPTIAWEDPWQRQDTLWKDDPQILGIDFNDAFHARVLEELFPAHYGAFDYPATRGSGR